MVNNHGWFSSPKYGVGLVLNGLFRASKWEFLTTEPSSGSPSSKDSGNAHHQISSIKNLNGTESQRTLPRKLRIRAIRYSGFFRGPFTRNGPFVGDVLDKKLVFRCVARYNCDSWSSLRAMRCCGTLMNQPKNRVTEMTKKKLGGVAWVGPMIQPDESHYGSM